MPFQYNTAKKVRSAAQYDDPRKKLNSAFRHLQRIQSSQSLSAKGVLPHSTTSFGKCWQQPSLWSNMLLHWQGAACGRL